MPVLPFALSPIRDRALGWEEEEAQSAGFREGQRRQEDSGVSPVTLTGQAVGTVLSYGWLVESSSL